MQISPFFPFLCPFLLVVVFAALVVVIVVVVDIVLT